MVPSQDTVERPARSTIGPKALIVQHRLITAIVRQDTKHTDVGRISPVSMSSPNAGVATFLVSQGMHLRAAA
jgi:hypothetical protein